MVDETTPPAQPPAEETPPRPLDKVERAEQAVKKMEETEKRLDEKIAKLAEMKAESLLSGTAGLTPPAQKKELTNKEYKDYVIKYGKPPQ